MTKTRFDTKKDWLGKCLLFGPALIVSTLTVLKIIGVDFGKAIPTLEPLLIGCLFFWLFIVLAWNFTDYKIGRTTLTARMALIRWKTIKLEDIKEIKMQEYGLFTFGLSKDVLSIKLKNGGQLNISPEQPQEFLQELEKRRTTANST